jgi:Zn-dependent protease
MDIDALGCSSCDWLLHGSRVQELVAEATFLAKEGRFDDSLARWRAAVPLLPPNSPQTRWVADQILRLEGMPRSRQQQARHTREASSWLKRLGPIGAIVLTLLKGKTFITLLGNAKFLLSLGAFIGVYWSIYGFAFGIGFALSIFLHEMGHYLEVKRRGLPADMPVFLPGIGAYVRWEAMGVPLQTRALVALAGPFAGLLTAAGCLFLWQTTGNPLWAALAHVGAWLNLLNLIPVTLLDGGHAMYSLDRTDRMIVLAAAVVGFFWLSEGVYLLIAVGALWRCFTKDTPEVSDRLVLVDMLALMALLGLVLHGAPDEFWMRGRALG